MQVGLRSFEALKPWYVKRLKELNSCCCRYHVQMLELKDAFNLLRWGTLHQSCGCTCGIYQGTSTASCEAPNSFLLGVTAMFELIQCPKSEGGEFHSLSCIRGNCPNCGVEKFLLCLKELDHDSPTLVTWRRFENVVVSPNEEGGVWHALQLEHKNTIAADLISYLKPKLAEFFIHNFKAQWQDKQFKAVMENLTAEEMVPVIDFVENYSFKDQNEVQSQHWFSFQVSILVHIIFRLDPSWDGIDPNTKLLTKYHFYISDDKTHDNAFVQHCFRLHWDFLVEQAFPLPLEHIVFSDGCATQFKCAKSLFFVARYPSLTRNIDMPVGCQMKWNHSGIGHGKGCWDGVGATVKQALRREQVKPNGLHLQNSHDVVAFLQNQLNREYAGYEGARKSVHHYFYGVKVGDVSHCDDFNCQRVPGTRSFYQMRSLGLDKISLSVRNLSCFCQFCTSGGDGPCDNDDYVPPYTLIRLEPCCPGDAQMDVETRLLIAGNDPKALAATLQVGDNFAVVAEEGNSKDVDFYILLC